MLRSRAKVGSLLWNMFSVISWRLNSIWTYFTFLLQYIKSIMTFTLFLYRVDSLLDNDRETNETAAARQPPALQWTGWFRSRGNPNRQERNSSTATEKRRFLLGAFKGVIRRTIEARTVSWKGAAIQRGLESRGRGIALLEVVTRKRIVTDWETWTVYSS
jgi:hypothetical protein